MCSLYMMFLLQNRIFRLVDTHCQDSGLDLTSIKLGNTNNAGGSGEVKTTRSVCTAQFQYLTC